MPIPEFIKTWIKEKKLSYTYCDIGHSGVSDEDVEELVTLLNQNRYIRELCLYRNNISNKGARQLAKDLPTSITRLNLGANNINDDGIKPLIERGSITELDLSSNNLTNDSVELLLSAAKQKEITVFHTKIDDNYAREIRLTYQLGGTQRPREEISFHNSEVVSENSDTDIVENTFCK